MKVEKKESLNIELVGDDAKLFKEVIETLKDGSKKAGYLQLPFNPEQLKFITKLSEEIK